MSAQSSANALSGISLVLPVTPNEPEVRTATRVRKRNGSFEPVDVNKIVRAVARCCVGLNEVLRQRKTLAPHCLHGSVSSR
jgi:ATP cone domain-containing protein